MSLARYKPRKPSSHLQKSLISHFSPDSPGPRTPKSSLDLGVLGRNRDPVSPALLTHVTPSAHTYRLYCSTALVFSFLVPVTKKERTGDGPRPRTISGFWKDLSMKPLRLESPFRESPSAMNLVPPALGILRPYQIIAAIKIAAVISASKY